MGRVDYAAIVTALYRHHKTWRKVAKACGDDPKRFGVYWDIAHGRVKKVHRRVKIGILNAVSALDSSVVKTTVPPRDLERRNVKIPVGLFERMKAVKNRLGETWQEYQEKALQARMEKG